MNAWHALGLLAFLALYAACAAMAGWADEARTRDAAEEFGG